MIKIPLTKGYEAVIDDEDADLLAYRYWATSSSENHVYAQRHIRHGTRSYTKRHLHRDVAERALGPIPKGHDVDHINHDTLDNRRSNLRCVPHQVNIWNRRAANKNSVSGIPGVRYRPTRGKWQAYICHGLKMISLGSFSTMEEARAARQTAEAERHSTWAV